MRLAVLLGALILVLATPGVANIPSPHDYAHIAFINHAGVAARLLVDGREICQAPPGAYCRYLFVEPRSHTISAVNIWGGYSNTVTLALARDQWYRATVDSYGRLDVVPGADVP